MGAKRILWLDCSSGVAGDMLAAALIDAGADRMAMERALESLPLDGYTICVSHVTKHSIRCCDFDVVLQPGLETHDHDMDHLFKDLDKGVPDHGPAHDHGQGHDHDADHGHHHDHDHVHRGLGEVLDILSAAELTDGARSLAQRTFFILADAEAEAHGATRETVHFHEVGSVDSIVDVVAVSVLADSLHLDAVHVTGLTEGTGLIRTSHGVLPIPVPAVSSILRAYAIPVRISERQGECITPTGAALVAALATSFEVPGDLAVRATGYGAGKRDYPWSNYVRAIVGTDAPGAAPNPIANDSSATEDAILKLECEVDDLTGEAMGETIGRLMDAGAREAHWIPLGTKKGRPAWQLQVICTPEDREALELEIFRDTTTIGIRRVAMGRTVLPRRELTLNVDFGGDEPLAIRAKLATLPDGTVRVMPEADDVARVSRELDRPLQEVWQRALAASVDAAR